MNQKVPREVGGRPRPCGSHIGSLEELIYMKIVGLGKRKIRGGAEAGGAQIERGTRGTFSLGRPHPGQPGSRGACECCRAELVSSYSFPLFQSARLA